jgi:hypothetical protein
MSRRLSKRVDEEWRRWRVGHLWKWATEALAEDEAMVVELARVVVPAGEMVVERVLRSRM